MEKKVGSPNYVKTPIFKKRRQYNDDNWNNIRAFKTTVIKEVNNKTEEIITNIRNILNKLTQETFENNKEQLLNILNDNELTNDDMLKVSELIFVIVLFLHLIQFAVLPYQQPYSQIRQIFLMKDYDSTQIQIQH